MLLSVTPKIVTFTANDDTRSRREKVEDAAAVTGGVGAGAAATRGQAFKCFKTSEKLRTMVNGASEATAAVAQPVKQTQSLWNACRLNYQNFKTSIANWAEASRMPKFMKAMFTGKLGSAIGKGAAVFVFVSGIGEVFDTCVKNADKLGVKMSTMAANPYKN